MDVIKLTYDPEFRKAMSRLLKEQGFIAVGLHAHYKERANKLELTFVLKATEKGGQ